MSGTYKTVSGDTFETIARKEYGSEVQAIIIQRANPGVRTKNNLLPIGTNIIVPTLPDAPKDAKQQAVSSGENEVAILLETTRFRFWDKIRLVRSLDTMDVVEFGAPFESDLLGFKETFRPFSFSDIEVTVGGRPLFTGTQVGVVPILENAQKVVSVSAYSTPGVLGDCTAPASSYPIEFNDQTLNEIAQDLAKPFGIGIDFRDDPGDVFERVALEPGQTVLTFLASLARQRNLIIASTSDGKLLFWRGIESGVAVARLSQGFSPLLSVAPFFSPQAYFSSITGIEPVFIGLAGSQFTVQNPRLLGVTRPFTFGADDTIEGGVEAAVAAKAGRMFGNMAAYSVRVDTWRDSFGKLWEPNTIVSLFAPDAMVYREYDFVIRTIEFDRTPKEESATLNLVIPGSFSGQIPDTLPWDL